VMAFYTAHLFNAEGRFQNRVENFLQALNDTAVAVEEASTCTRTSTRNVLLKRGLSLLAEADNALHTAVQPRVDAQRELWRILGEATSEL